MKPFIKWAGGKRQLLPILELNLPEKFNRYFEPFLGGGAMFLHLHPENAVVGDLNAQLVNAYEVIKTNPMALIRALQKMKNTAAFFYRVRKQNPKNLSPVAQAARFIYLNRTCFNGLYRENSKGEFNVPFGDYANPKICDRENLLELSEFLNQETISLQHGTFEEILKEAQAGDFVYLDSPYYPLKPSSFTSYQAKGFKDEDHRRLAEVFRELDARGCFVLMSNSNTKFIKDLYKGYKIQAIHASRSINSSGKGRAKAKIEVIIKNY